MSTFRIGALFVIAVIGALIYIERPGGTDSRHELTRQAEALAKAQRDIEALTGELRTARAERRWQALASASPRVRTPDSAVAAGASSPDAPARDDAQEPASAPAPTMTDYQLQLEDWFDRRGDDGDGWATSARERVLDGVERTLPEASALVSVDCRGSLCRIETAHATMDGFHAFLDAAFTSSATELWNGVSMTRLVDGTREGELIAVSFLAREGGQLPAPE